MSKKSEYGIKKIAVTNFAKNEVSGSNYKTISF